jgi:predicted type IV restriction endonuclease
MTCSQGRDEVAKLVAQFRINRAAYLAPTYLEAHARQQLIDPLFIALGWDVHNTQRAAPDYTQVIFEARLQVGANKRAPDYTFRTGKRDYKFFVEAKKPGVSIKTDASAAYQVRVYGWNAELPLSILTDFEELAVYDCRNKPKPSDKPAVARVDYYTCEEYPDRWQELWDQFSYEAVLQGKLDHFVETLKSKRSTLTVDADFLATIEQWRKSLAQNIALRNEALDVPALNDAVQRTLDRLIFMRIAEDRDIEPYAQLQDAASAEHIYRRLMQLFKQADTKYNSGLFNFAEDKRTPQLKIDDKVLQSIISDLYGVYNFRLMPPEILGNVYEQFLGKVIRLTPAHQAKVEEKPEVRKAGGVYYTPTYIVDYIVRHTVGKWVEGKTPKEVSRLRVLDMACGSGSFLLGAYQYLLDWHLQWYVEHEPHQHVKAVQSVGTSPQTTWRLTTNEKKRVLLNNIYGVDIDRQAVEVTKLSLLLKVLEGESQETLQPQLLGLEAHAQALPNLDQNIKCGNSLIGSDYFTGQMMPDADELRRVNAFDWQSEFPDVMKVGGFDCVIGNPPYVRQEILGEGFKTYAKKKYITYAGTADLYAYFIERGVSLLKRGGLFGFIVANKWTRANYGEPLRHWLKQQCIAEITDFGDLPVFKLATTYPCILIIRQDSPQAAFSATKVETLDFKNLAEYVQANHYTVNQMKLDDSGWSLSDENAQGLLEKLRAVGMPLGDYVKGEIYYGIKTGDNEAFVIDAKTRKQLIADDPKSAELIKPFLIGREVKRYQTPTSEKFLIFTRHGISIKNYPAVQEYLEQFKEQLVPKPKGWKGKEWKGRKAGAYQWYEIQDTVDYYAEFEKPKIIYPNICKQPEFTFDTKQLYTNQKCFIIPIDDKYLLGVLNSAVTNFLFRTILPKLRGDFYEPSYVYFKDFPIRPINFSDPADQARHDRMVSLVTQMLNLHKRKAATQADSDREIYERQIAATDRAIDALVYELYGLTEEEIKVVEGTGK